MKILAVDDKPDNLDLLCQILEEDHEVVTAGSGEACMALATEHKPHLILLDVMMPGMNGFEVLAQLKENPETRPIYVVFLTARYRDTDRIIRGLDMGAFDYITKPVEDELLLAKVRCVERFIQMERALEEAKVAAERANASKGIFLATMSHEIRTPLSCVLGLLQQYDPAGLSAGDREKLDLIRQSSQSLHLLLNDVLDFATIESGKMTFVANDFNLREVVNRVVKPMRFLAVNRGLDLTVQVDAAVPKCARGDELRVRQVLNNLLSNAVKFTRQGQVTLRVQKLPTTGSGTLNLAFTVEDTGVGIPEGNHADLFDAFTQVDNSLSRVHDGTGLGLAICKRVVELMGGSIVLESQPGKGSVFRATIGLEVAKLTTSNRHGSTQAPKTPPLSILLVEDEPVSRRVSQGFLELGGHAVAHAQNGFEAVKQVLRNSYDLILMDLRMPHMSGIEATQRIRCLEDPVKSSVPIIALTADVVKDNLQKCLDTGMQAVLTKPIDLGTLNQTLHRVSGSESGLGPAHDSEPTPASGGNARPSTRRNAACGCDVGQSGKHALH